MSSNKPSYEELEYQLAVTYAGYQEQVEKVKELEGKLLSIQEDTYKQLQGAKACINKALNSTLGHNDLEEQQD